MTSPFCYSILSNGGKKGVETIVTVEKLYFCLGCFGSRTSSEAICVGSSQRGCRLVIVLKDEGTTLYQAQRFSMTQVGGDANQCSHINPYLLPFSLLFFSLKYLRLAVLVKEDILILLMLFNLKKIRVLLV